MAVVGISDIDSGRQTGRELVYLAPRSIVTASGRVSELSVRSCR